MCLPHTGCMCSQTVLLCFSAAYSKVGTAHKVSPACQACHRAIVPWLVSETCLLTWLVHKVTRRCCSCSEQKTQLRVGERNEGPYSCSTWAGFLPASLRKGLKTTRRIIHGSGTPAMSFLVFAEKSSLGWASRSSPGL